MQYNSLINKKSIKNSKKEHIIKCFITSIDLAYKHVNAMFLIDYEPFENDFKGWNKIEKQRLVKEINFHADGLKRENPNNYIKIPISEDGKYFTMKYSNYCKCHGLNGNPITLPELKGHKIKATVKVLKYNFKDPKSNQNCIGVYISVSKIEMYSL
jgi:hypothetical protein